MKSASTKHTEQLCNYLAKHLSTRKECRCEEYMLNIQDGLIVCWPNVAVFPDRYTRRSGAKLPVLQHVLTYHLPNCGLKDDKFGGVKVSKGFFVNGIYRYKTSVDKRSRKWFRVM